MNICPRFSNIICLFFVGINLKCFFERKKRDVATRILSTAIDSYSVLLENSACTGRKEEEEGLIDLCKRRRAFWHARRIPPHTMHCTWCCCIDLCTSSFSPLLLFWGGEKPFIGEKGGGGNICFSGWSSFVVCLKVALNHFHLMTISFFVMQIRIRRAFSSPTIKQEKYYKLL